MKTKKSIVKKVLIFTIIFTFSFKIYLEINNYNYESNLVKIENRMQTKITTEHKTLDLGDCKIHYYISGKENKNTVLFLHPAFSDHSAFDQQIDFFSKDYKVITLDLIGHGLSNANTSKEKIDNSSDHIFKIIEKEKTNKIDLVGVSMGALIAQYFALQHPNKVNSLTALGAYDINKKDPTIEKTQRTAMLSLLFRAIFSRKSFRKELALQTCHSKKGQDLFYKTTRFFERKSLQVMQGLQNIIEDRQNVIIKHPTLILVGNYDIELAIKMAENWHSTLTNSEYFTIKNTGHCANLDAPLLFNQKVKQFINKYN